MHNFLPYWYIKKKNDGLNRRLKKHILILILLNITISAIIGIKFTEMKRINNNISNIINKNNSLAENRFVKNDEVLKNLEQFMLIYSDNLNISNVKIENSQIEFICNIKEDETIINLIENIELEKVFSIKYLSPFKENKDYNNFKVVLEGK